MLILEGRKISDLSFYLKREKEEQIKPKLRTGQKIKIRVDQRNRKQKGKRQ